MSHRHSIFIAGTFILAGDQLSFCSSIRIRIETIPAGNERIKSLLVI